MPTATVSKETLAGEEGVKAAGIAASDVAAVAAVGEDSDPASGEAREPAAPMSGTGIAEGAAPQRQVWRVKDEMEPHMYIFICVRQLVAEAG